MKVVTNENIRNVTSRNGEDKKKKKKKQNGKERIMKAITIISFNLERL